MLLLRKMGARFQIEYLESYFYYYLHFKNYATGPVPFQVLGAVMDA